MKLPLRSAAIKSQCEGLSFIDDLTPLVIPPICDVTPPTGGSALVQTSTLSALVQTGTLSALIQTGSTP